jgi:hypothetical protein
MRNLACILKTSVLALLLACVYMPVSAQFPAGKSYATGEIPQLHKFEKLTEREARIDTSTLRFSKERLARMEAGTAFREGVSAEDKAAAIAYEKASFSRYKDNRSRYYLQAYTNGQLNPEPFMGIDTLTTDCNCTLAGDTLQIQMGIWVFGGFTVHLKLLGNTFQSIYWEDTHEQPVYKARLGDSILTDNLYVENVASRLLLDRKPQFRKGESLLGYFTFTTADYLQLKYPEGTDRETFNRLKLEGSLHFKCVVKELPEGK